MADWRIVGGPFEYYESGLDAISVGWAWDVERAGRSRVIRVEVAKSAAQVRFTDAQKALRDVLSEDEPPARLLLTSHAVSRTGPVVDVHRSD